MSATGEAARSSTRFDGAEETGKRRIDCGVSGSVRALRRLRLSWELRPSLSSATVSSSAARSCSTGEDERDDAIGRMRLR
jgi:hypothetical protein